VVVYYLQHRTPETLDRARAILESLENTSTVLSPYPAPLGWPTSWVRLPDGSPDALGDWIAGSWREGVIVDGSSAHLRAAVGQGRRTVAVAVPGVPGRAEAADLVLAPWAPFEGEPIFSAPVLHLGAIGAGIIRAAAGRPATAAVGGAWQCLSLSATASGPGPRERREIIAGSPAWQWWFASERELLTQGPVWETLARSDVLVCAATSVNLAAAAAVGVPVVLVGPATPSPAERFLIEAARHTAPVIVAPQRLGPDQWRLLLVQARELDSRTWDRWSPGPGLAALNQALGIHGRPGAVLTSPLRDLSSSDQQDEEQPMSTGDVTTFYDGHEWSYEIEGERPLGHSFQERAPAVAGGRFLAIQHGGVHTIKDETGAVCERHSYQQGSAGT
jgi:hypothetical protein